MATLARAAHASHAAHLLPDVDVVSTSDGELAAFEAEASRRATEINAQIARLRGEWWHHEQRRRQLARLLLMRTFSASSFGRMLVDLVLPFLVVVDVLRWSIASPAAAGQLCAQEDGAGRQKVCHLRGTLPDLTTERARSIVAGIHWPSMHTMAADLGNLGSVRLLEALGEERSEGGDGASDLRGLRGLSLSFPPERSAVMLQKWRAASPVLMQLEGFFGAAPLQELVLTDLRSTEVLAGTLRCCCMHIRIVRASFVGPESRRHALELPSQGLPALECLMVRYRDFCEQRVSRQERMSVLVEPLLACLESIRAKDRLRVLALGGIRLDGGREATAVLLRRLHAFPGLVSVALRFGAVPATFGALMPLQELLGLRRSWPSVGHFQLGDTSVHGFDYWPEQVTDFKQKYPRCQGTPTEEQVFRVEFGYVLTSQYNTSPEHTWEKMEAKQKAFWKGVADRLPIMPRGELVQHVADVFPSGL